MIPQIKEINLPSYATLCKATAEYKDMAEKTITSQVSIDGQIAPDFSFDWEVHHMGEKFIMPLRTPQASKENTSLNSKIDLTFQHWAIYQLKRWYFFTLQSYNAGVAVADKYIASVSLNLKNFCDLYGQLLNHYYGDAITIDLNPSWQSSEEPVYIDINYSYMWDVLIKLYELFAVRWEIVANGDPDHYTIKVGYPVEEMNHIFEYGFEGGLLKVERQVQDDNIRNMLLGRGGDKNIPLLYFKKADPDNPMFQADPDWVEELANVYFDRLRSAEFRSYIQGWKAKNISKYPGYTAVGESKSEVPWAYRKGYADTKFDPVEYVKDDESIRKYGELLGGLENNDEIYPSIQGVVIDQLGRIDQVVDVEQVTGDTLDEQKQNEVDTWNESVPSYTASTTLRQKFNTITIKIPNYKLKVPEGYTGSILNYKAGKSMFLTELNGHDVGDASNDLLITSDTAVAFDSEGKEIAGEGLTEGEYEIGFKIGLEADNVNFNTHYGRANVTISNITVAYGVASDSQKNQATFDVWIKNIWQTAPDTGESAEAYAERVWKPILGNHLGDEAAVCFSSGLLSTSEDYTFLILGKTISKGIHYDTSKTLNGVQSHWRLTLVRSTADYDSLGKLVPNLERQGKAGDYFYFTGIELTHYYVNWAEKRLHDYKLDQLAKVSDIQPSWVVGLDKVRIGTPHYEETQSLLSQLHIGGSVRIADKRFIGGSEQLYLYLQQITYKYNENANKANLTPDVEVILGTDYQTTANPVATIQSQIDAIHNQLGGYSTSNIQQIVRMVGDRIYLRKDGITDRSQSVTYFAQLLAALGFRQGMTGGYGWGFYQDENGKWVLETDRVNVRDEMQVNSLVINQIQARGGMIVESAASIEAINVEELSDTYKVYFDTKHGSVGNLFKVDDVAYCHRYTSENQDLKYYKRRVMEVGEDYITLSKNIKDGQGIPSEGDVVVHYGNYTDKERQYVIVRDVMGGGYERMLSGLDSVTASGDEYYFAGYQSSTGERFFIGTRKDNQYIEYINGKLYIPGQLILGSSVDGEKTMLDYIKENGGLSQEEIEKIAQEKAKEEADKVQKEAKDYADAIEKSAKDYADAMGEDLQKQIDGAIETWFYPDVPTLNNEPAINWKTDEQKNVHLGDLYYDQKTGKCYRFQKDGNKYEWREITDTDIQAALEAANKAQDTADHKRRVFLEQPKPPYDEGDLWVNATYGTQYKNDILRCKAGIHKGEGETFAIGDWGLASDYTNDDYAHTFDYLSKALNDGRTEIGGGLILSSLIALGTWDGSFQTIYSGINGLPLTAKDDPDYLKKGLGIAAWYGGDMLDKEYPQTPLPSNPRYAQSLFRFDGSGYLAGGQITWDALGNLTLNSGIKISGGGSLQSISNDIASFSTLLNKFTNAFRPILASTGQEGTWGQVNNIETDVIAIRAVKGLFSDDFISVRGLNPDADKASGKSYLYDLLDVNNTAVKNPSAGQALVFRNGKWTAETIQTGGLDINALESYLSGKNYATQQWVRDQNYLTSHQDLTKYLRESRASAGTDIDTQVLYSPFIQEIQNATGTVPVPGNQWVQIFNWGTTDAGYAFEMANAYGGVGNLYFRQRTASSWKSWKTVMDSSNIGSFNAGSATKLRDTWNIWGQPFNATGPVDGLFRSLITSSAGNGTVVHKILIYPTSPYGLVTYLNSAGATLLQSQREVGNEYFALCLNHLGGNVGVGLTNPTYKLHLSGTFYASGAVTLASTLNVGDTAKMRNTLPYSDYNYTLGDKSYKWGDIYTYGVTASDYVKIGSATLLWNEAEQCVVIDKGFASEKFISTKGINSGSGGTVGGAYLPLTGGTINGNLTIRGMLTSIGDLLLGTTDSDNVRMIGNDIFINADYSLNLSGKEYVSITGNVGIGVSNPAVPLHVNGTIRTKALLLEEDDSTFTGQNLFGMYVWNNVLQFNRRTTANVWIANMMTMDLATGRIGFNANPNNSYQVYISGTLGVSGAVSQNTSDLRLKTDIDTDIDCLEILLKLGNVFRYRYNGLAVSERNWLDTTTIHTGIAYQNAVTAGIPGFTGIDEKGYGYVNFLSSDYQATLVGGLIRVYLIQMAMQNDVNWLKKEVIGLREENRDLKLRVEELERA